MNDYYRASVKDFPWCNFDSKIKSIVVKKGVTWIGGYSFIGCENVKKVSLPKSLKEIGIGAFGSKKLSKISIPNGVKTIGSTAFSGCSSLKKITIPGSVKLIGECAFWNCKKLEKVTLSEGLKSIEFEAFYGCPKLKKITIPKSVTRIGDGAFGAESTYYDEYNDRLVYYYDEDFCIYGQNNTAAERYAKENGIKFKTA